MQILKKNVYNKYNGKQKSADEYRVNETIKSSLIRLIGEKGTQLGVFSRCDGLYRAKSLSLDLVEVSSYSNPPVCKLMDYGKFKYEQKRKMAIAKKKQITSEIKEIKFRPKTGDHDFDFKLKNLKKFLSQSKKVKITVVFKGREIIHVDLGKKMLEKVISDVKDYATVDFPPKMEGKLLIIILSPAK